MSPRISEEIVEDEHEDDNFAVVDDEMDFEPSLTTYLSPPPSKRFNLELSSFSPLPALQIEDKPLSNLPQSTLKRPEPKSHFSVDSISTTMSPVDSNFDFTPSTSECNDDATEDVFFGPITQSPEQAKEERARTANPFRGYSLPFDKDEDRKMYSGKMTPMAYTMPNVISCHNNSRETFGFEHNIEPLPSSNFDQLIVDMGYLGEMIDQ